MLKKLTLGYTIAFVIIAAIAIGFMVFGEKTLSLNSISSYSRYYVTSPSLLTSILKFANDFVTYNIAGFISVIISSSMLHKDENNLMAKVGIFAAFVTAGLYLIFFILTLCKSFMPEAVITVVSFIIVLSVLSYIFIIPLLLTMNIEADNNISGKLKNINIFVIGFNLLTGIVFVLSVLLASSMRDIRSMSNVAPLALGSLRFFVVSMVAEYIIIALGYIFNYSLSGGDLKETEELEMENDAMLAELKKQAELQAQMRQQSYNAAAQQAAAQPAQQTVVQQPVQPVVQEPVQQVVQTPVVEQPVAVQPAPQPQVVENSLENLMQSSPQANVQPNNQ